MAIKFSNVLGIKSNNSVTSSGDSKKRRPLLNEIPYGYGQQSSLLGNSLLSKKQEFMKWFKENPELNSPIQARVDDTIVDVDFFDAKGQPLGRNTEIKAKEFWDNNFMNFVLKSVWFDAIATGSGFGWKGKPNIKQLSEKMKEVIKKYSKDFNISVREAHAPLLLRALDEDVSTHRKFDYVASSTMSIMHDKYTVTGYVQNFGGITEEFNPDEIIHFPFANIDGKVDGWTPIESLAREMILLWFVKENMVAYVRNGGLPRKIFSLPEELANSENHKWLVSLLERYGAVENRHGNLVLTGKVDVIDLEEKMQDMQYEELALYITSNIAYALRVPVSRIPYLIGKSASSGDAGGMAESGYWNMIASDQQRIEQLFNTQLCKDMGFTIRFKKRYRIDDLRETQAMTMRADAITKMNTILVGYQSKLTESKIAELMDLNLGDIQEMTPEESMMSNPMMQKTGLLNQNLLNKNALSNPDKYQKNETKSNAAVNNPKGANQGGY